MECAPKCWYSMADLFDPVAYRYTLRDVESSYLFSGSALLATTGVVTPRARPGRLTSGSPKSEEDLLEETTPYQCLQMRLEDVPKSAVDRLSNMQSISRQVIRENMLLISQAGYAYKLRLHSGERYFQSVGEVCVSLRLSDDAVMTSVSLSKKDRVSSYVERGMIDGEIQSKASLRIKNRPMLNKVGAIQDSGYLPDEEWQIDVLFANWSDEASGDWVTALSLEDIDLMQSADIMFYPESRYRDFRMTDLFDAPGTR